MPYPTPTKNPPALQIQSLIQQVNKDAREHAEAGTLTKKEIAVILEMNQRYKEYLDDLEIAEIEINTDVITKIDGETIRFSSIEDVAEWITANK